MKSSGFRFVILTAMALGLVAAFAYYLYRNEDKYLQLLHLSPTSVAGIFVLSLALPFITGMIDTSLFRSIGAPISYRDGFLLTAATSLANQLPVSGGPAVRVFYLKRKFSLAYTRSFSADLAFFVCSVGANGLVGMAILMFWILFRNLSVSPALLVGFASMISCLLIVWAPVDRLPVPGRVRKWVHQAVEGWILISRNPLLLLRLVGLQISLLVLLGVRYWLAFHMLSQNVTLGQVMLFSTASILTQLVGFAPGGLGVREAIVAAVASALGFEAGVSAVAVGLDRLISTVPILAIGAISSLILGKQVSDLSTTAEQQEESV